ncbi:MAG: hypothetical protein ABEH61_05655 [Haloarculaceae archaeon]
MALGNARLRSERIRTPGDLLLDEPAASHLYAWLFEHEPATVEAYIRTVDVNDRQARLAANRLRAHGLVEETDGGLTVDPIQETVDGVHVTPGVAAVLAVQLENYNVRRFVRRHGSLALAEAVACWPLVDQGALESNRVGNAIGVDEKDGVTATNALRAASDYLESDPFLDEIPTPSVATAVPVE